MWLSAPNGKIKVQVDALIDTGSQATLVKNDVVDLIKGTMTAKPMTLTTADQRAFRTDGVTTLNIDVTPSRSFTFSNVLVTPSLSYDAILGTDFLRATGATISFQGDTVIDIGSRTSLSEQAPAPVKDSQDQERASVSRINAIETERLNFTAAPVIDDPDEPPPALSLPPDPLGEPPTEDELRAAAAGDEDLYALLCDYKDVLAWSGQNPGVTSSTMHSIDTGDAPPAASRPYPVSPADEVRLKKHIDEMCTAGIIRPSSSPWAAPAFFKVKPEGDIRLLIDYRKLNKVTAPDAYPMKTAASILMRLQGAKIFTTLDLKSGYWQVPVAAQDVPKTAFATPFGLYESLVMPFGLRNAPATFQRLMDNVLAPATNAVAYMDDVLVYATDHDSALRELRGVFELLRRHGLHIKLSKCKFLQTELRYLGNIIGANGVRPDPADTAAMRDLAAPTNVKQLQSFLGSATYYRRFIRDFAYIAQPLYKLTRKETTWKWTEEHQRAFEQLKRCLCSPPVLAFPDWNKEFTLTTDASSIGLGAVLEQADNDGQLHPIGYASRVLNPAERNYSATDREALALVWGIKHFYTYLAPRPFTVFTDHSALRALTAGTDPHARHARYLAFLQTLSFTVVHRPGKEIPHADYLSRASSPNQQASSGPPQDAASDNPHTHVNAVNQDVNNLQEDLLRAQGTDDFCREIKGIIQEGKDASNRDLAITKDLYSIDQDGRLVRADPNNNMRDTLVVPRSMIPAVLRAHHDDPMAGHLSASKCLDVIRRRYFWPRMRTDIEEYIASCAPCQRRKTPRRPVAGRMIPIAEDRPFGTLALDFVGPLPATHDGNIYVLVATDHFTKWVEAFPTQAADAETVARVLVNEIFSRHGAPARMLSDRGQAFLSELVKAVCKQFGTANVYTTAYHPQTDGTTERFNATLMDTVAIFTSKHQKDWDTHLPKLLLAYRNSVHASTNETPFYLVYGRDPVLPFDIALKTPLATAQGWTDVDAYKHDLATALVDARDAARVALNRAHMTQHAGYDARHRDHTFKVGDPVWLFVPHVTRGLSPKLASRWQGPYRITRKLSPVNVELEMSGRRLHQFVHVARLKHAVLRDTPPPQDDQVQLPADDTFDFEAEDYAQVHEPTAPPAQEEESTTAPADVYEIERIVRRVSRGQYEIKWAGYPDTTIEPSRNIPARIRQEFERQQALRDAPADNVVTPRRARARAI